VPHGRPSLRSRLHFGHNREWRPQSPYGTCGGMGGGDNCRFKFRCIYNKRVPVCTESTRSNCLSEVASLRLRYGVLSFEHVTFL
jgi:hypothetical protein